MTQDFSRFIVPLSTYERDQLRKDLKQGSLALILPWIIIAPFIWIFATEIPQDTAWGWTFIGVPLAVVAGITILVIYRLKAMRMDLKSGEKNLVKGVVERKYVRIRGYLKKGHIRNLPDRMRHFILVGGQRYLVKGFEYDSCSLGQQVNMYATPYSKRVLDFQVSDVYVTRKR